MPEILMLVGLPGSGKSTHASQWLDQDPSNRERLSYDMLRLEMYGPDWVFNYPEEKAMKTEGFRRLREWVLAGKSVVIDNTNMTTKARESWRSIAHDLNVTLHEKWMETSISECVARDAKREGKARVGRAVIERMALDAGWIDFNNHLAFPRPIVIIDMDGTLADCTARRRKAALPSRHNMMVHHTTAEAPQNPPQAEVLSKPCDVCGVRPKLNWDIFYEGCEQDPPIEPVRRIAHVLSQNYEIVIVSGRPIDKAGKQTEEWLRRNFHWPIRHLLMRPSGDSRPDFVMKEEILDRARGGPQNIIACLDDRNQVVEMWRRKGLLCMQVAEGDF